MTIRFQADADFNQMILLAANRHEPTLDFQTASAGDVLGLADAEVLAIAAREERVLVTHDKRTMPRYFAEFTTTRASSGLLVVPQSMPLGTVIEDLLLIQAVTQAEVWINRLAFLPL